MRKGVNDILNVGLVIEKQKRSRPIGVVIFDPNEANEYIQL